MEESRRNDFSISYNMPAKKLYKMEEGEGDYTTRFSNNILYRFYCDEKTEIDFVNKATPHALYETMLIDAGREFKFSAFEYAENVQKEIFNLIYLTFHGAINYQKTEANPDYAIVGTTNYDPFTIDRRTIMTEKRYHFHTICYTRNEYELALSTKSGVDIIGQSEADRIIDPVTVQIIDMMYKYICKRVNTKELINSSSDFAIKHGLPIGIKLKLSSVDKIKEEATIGIMNKVHRAIIEFYVLIHHCIFGKVFENTYYRPWYRPEPLCNTEITRIAKQQLLDEDDIRTLLSVADRFRYMFRSKRVSDEYYNDPYLAIFEVPLAGPAYSLSIFINNGIFASDLLLQDVIISFYPKFFSDLGGAGMTSFGGINAIKIKRGQGFYTKEEEEKRSVFLKYVLKRMTDDYRVKTTNKDNILYALLNDHQVNFNNRFSEADKVEQEVFISKNKFALPSKSFLYDKFIDYVEKTCDNALILCDYYPLESLLIYTKRLTVIGEDLASIKAANVLMNATIIDKITEIESRFFDLILVLCPISSMKEPLNSIKALYERLLPGGTLWLMEENRVGFHRLGDHLMNEYRKELPKCWNQQNLEALFPHVDAYPVYDDSTEYDDLLELLIQKYPKHRRRMKNGLKLIETVFRITKEG